MCLESSEKCGRPWVIMPLPPCLLVVFDTVIQGHSPPVFCINEYADFQTSFISSPQTYTLLNTGSPFVVSGLAPYSVSQFHSQFCASLFVGLVPVCFSQG